MRRSLLGFSLFIALSGLAHAETKGFVVFSRAETRTYEFAPDRSLRSTASAPARDPRNHVVRAGRVYGIDPLLGRIYRLGPDLKEDRSVVLGGLRSVARILGTDEKNIYVFFDNTLEAFDAELKPAGHAVLDPAKRGEMVPAVTVDACQFFGDHAYLLAGNTGDVFAVDLKTWTAVRVPLNPDGAAGEARGQWIDPASRTLNVLVNQIREEHTADLEDMERRVIKTEIVLTLPLADLLQPARATTLREEREIHHPYPPGFLEGVQRQNAQGIIVDYPPPYRQERPPRGIHISRMSATIPCFAEVYVEDEGHAGALGPPDFVALGTGAKTEKVERFREPAHDAIWFKHDGEVHILTHEAGEWRLRLQPADYLKLLEIPGVADATALAY